MQHEGLELELRSIYTSLRLNRKHESSAASGMGNLMIAMDATPYTGKDIKLKFAARVAKGNAYGWLRIDRKDRKMGFFDNMNDRTIKAGEWKHYEVTGPVAQDAERINFGCFKKDAGKLWLDDFQLFVKDKDSEKWKAIALDNPGFEEDEDGKAPGGQWRVSGPPNFLLNVSSDQAFEGSKSVQIEEAPSAPIKSGMLFESTVKFGDHIAKDLGSGLSCLMPLALYGSEKQTFPAAPAETLNALRAAVKNELPEKLSGNELYVRLGNVVNCWNVFQHFYPYFDQVPADWKAQLTKSLKSSYKDKTEDDFHKTLERLVAELHDGHGRVGFAKKSTKLAFPPVQLKWIEEKLVVCRVFDKEITDVQPGDIVARINGVPAKEAIENEKKHISAATEGWMRYRYEMTLLLGDEGSPFKLELERDGKTFNVELKHDIDYRAYFTISRDRPKSKVIEDGIYYLNLDKITMPEIMKLMPELEKAKAIICDLRGYPKSNHMLISHLLKENDTSKAWMRVPRVERPDYEKVTYRELGWEMKTAKPHLNAKIGFITRGMAVSYAESYMGFIEHYKLATIVGQPTAGTNGNINPFSLPGGYRVTWTGMRVVKHDGSQHHGVGIIPHVPVSRTIKGVKEGRDEFLEKAIEVAKKQIKEDVKQ